MESTATSAISLLTGHANALTTDFDSIVRTYRPAVFRFALASLRDRDAAETIAQDCFWKAFSNRSAFRGDCGLKTWLMQIAVNLIRDHARNRRLRFWRRAQLEPADSLSRCMDPGLQSPEAAVLCRERVALLWAAVDKLPEKQRCVFLLRFVEDMEIPEIAAAAGMKEGTVKSHLFRALAMVRKRMEPAL